MSRQGWFNLLNGVCSLNRNEEHEPDIHFEVTSGEMRDVHEAGFKSWDVNHARAIFVRANAGRITRPNERKPPLGYFHGYYCKYSSKRKAVPSTELFEAMETASGWPQGT
jgi:hypothetical protein